MGTAGGQRCDRRSRRVAGGCSAIEARQRGCSAVDRGRSGADRCSRPVPRNEGAVGDICCLSVHLHYYFYKIISKRAAFSIASRNRANCAILRVPRGEKRRRNEGREVPCPPCSRFAPVRKPHGMARPTVGFGALHFSPVKSRNNGAAQARSRLSARARVACG